MLRQFPLICDASLSDAVYDYKDVRIYTYEMNRQGGNLELHAMVLVGWGYSDGGETEESIIGVKSNETSKDLEESDEDAEEDSGEGEELNEDRKVKHYYIVMCNWRDKWGQGGFGLMEELLNIFRHGVWEVELISPKQYSLINLGKALTLPNVGNLKQVAVEGSGEREESDENNKHYTVMFNWGDKWGRGGFGHLEKKLIRLCIIP
ncbi:hypothetical protein EV2_029765 [Malus domestica]